MAAHFTPFGKTWTQRASLISGVKLESPAPPNARRTASVVIRGTAARSPGSITHYMRFYSYQAGLSLYQARWRISVPSSSTAWGRRRHASGGRRIFLCRSDDRHRLEHPELPVDLICEMAAGEPAQELLFRRQRGRCLCQGIMSSFCISDEEKRKPCSCCSCLPKAGLAATFVTRTGSWDPDASSRVYRLKKPYNPCGVLCSCPAIENQLKSHQYEPLRHHGCPNLADRRPRGLRLCSWRPHAEGHVWPSPVSVVQQAPR